MQQRIRVSNAPFVTTVVASIVAVLVAAFGAVTVLAASPGAAATEAPTAPTAPTAPRLAGWAPPFQAEHQQGGLSSVSCPSPTFCLTVDSVGNAVTYDGTRWSHPQRIVPTDAVTHTFPQTAVASCASATFCVAIEAGDISGGQTGTSYAETWDGSTWSALTPMYSTTVMAVSCPTTSMCMAVTRDGHAVEYGPSGWSAPMTVNAPGALLDVACASATFCMAVGGGSGTSFAYQFDGSTWQASAGSTTRQAMAHVTCPTTGWCMAESTYGVRQYTGGAWGHFTRLTSGRGNRLADLTCFSSAMCLAISYHSYLAYDGTGWSVLHGLGTHGMYVSDSACSAATSCVAVANNYGQDEPSSGFALDYDGSSWSRPVSVDPGRGYLSAVSCPSPSFCVATDQLGYVLTRRDGTWTSSTRLDHTSPLIAVSCSSAAFCAATDAVGDALTYDGTAWSQPIIVTRTDTFTRALSCGSPTLCIALTRSGGASLYDGTNWSAPTPIKPGLVATSVSCTSATFCTAIGLESGQLSVTTFDGTNWSGYTRLGAQAATESVACGSASLCAIGGVPGGPYGGAWTFDGSTWKQSASYGAGTSPAVSCSTICAFVDNGNAQIFNGHSWGGVAIIDPHAQSTGVSCTTGGFCMVSEAEGWVVRHRAAT